MTPMSADEQEAFDERAGIAEFDGCQSRKTAEMLASLQILALRGQRQTAKWRAARNLGTDRRAA